MCMISVTARQNFVRPAIADQLIQSSGGRWQDHKIRDSIGSTSWTQKLCKTKVLVNNFTFSKFIFTC